MLVKNICQIERGFGKHVKIKASLKDSLKDNIKNTKTMKVRVKRAIGPVSKTDPCTILGERAKTNAIEMHSMQGLGTKLCSGFRGALTRVKDYECGRCKGLHNDEEEMKYVKLGNDMIAVVQEFCYLSEVVGSSEVVVMFKVQ